MKFRAFSIAAGAALVTMSIATLAQTAKQPDAGVSVTPNQRGPNQEGQSPGQGSSADETRNQSQAQPQGSTGPTSTKSGGAPASSPQGETPAGMQAAPQGSPAQSKQGPSGH